MAGVLFVISIPTEAEELKLKNKPRKLQFHPELQYDQPVTPIFTIKGIETPKVKRKAAFLIIALFECHDFLFKFR